METLIAITGGRGKAGRAVVGRRAILIRAKRARCCMTMWRERHRSVNAFLVKEVTCDRSSFSHIAVRTFDRRSDAAPLSDVADSSGAVHERNHAWRSRAARGERDGSYWSEHRWLRS